jgi:hypothetical protein
VLNGVPATVGDGVVDGERLGLGVGAPVTVQVTCHQGRGGREGALGSGAGCRSGAGDILGNGRGWPLIIKAVILRRTCALAVMEGPAGIVAPLARLTR